MNAFLTKLGAVLTGYLSEPIRHGSLVATTAPEKLAAALRPGDVLLVEGSSRISVAIKYLTQSTWSHAALYIGNALGAPAPGDEPKVLVEADMRDGVQAVALSAYAGMHTRICRPVSLSDDDLHKVIDYAVSRIGHRYDLKNVLDLARFLVPTPPVPVRWRRRMIAFGSGDPSRAICSTLIAQAFQSVHYPILPVITLEKTGDPACLHCYRETLHIRHHSLFTPRDFDISPYFEIVKPTLLDNFDYRRVAWANFLAEGVPASAQGFSDR
ncbi:MAG: YiiX/YebB-like N1pC/P60 family cysteine hydrolase [Gammaproteobacteria bacterium]